MRKITERELTRLIMDYLKWVPNSSFKKIRGSMGMKGILDIIGCWEGRYIELEVKTERGRLTPEQQARIEEIRKAGGMAEVITSLEEVHNIFGEKSRITINF
jgi:hypothetical protein